MGTNLIYLITIIVIVVGLVFYLLTPERTVISGPIKGLKETKFFNSEKSCVCKYIARINCHYLGNCRVNIPEEFYEDIKKIRQAKENVCVVVEKYKYRREYFCIFVSKDI